MYKHIMLALDGSELSLKALKEGIALAKSMGARLTAITVVPHFHLGVMSGRTSKIVQRLEKEHEEESKKHAEELHADIKGRAKAEGVQCDSLIVVGDNPYEDIIANAKKGGCELIVMASHGRKGWDAVMLGSETTKVLTHSKIPVLVVR
jgi:nucleotide-binding universal stress UspA family protein